MKSSKIQTLMIGILCVFFTIDAGSYTRFKYGRCKPIADNAHPNLFYNQNEVNKLRDMILQKKQPAELVGLYTGKIRSAVAKNAPADQKDHKKNYSAGIAVQRNNMKACISYMIEPTAAKADKIKASIKSFMAAHPNGQTGGHGVGFVGYSLPWMFDLLQAYHASKMTTAERKDIKGWFKKCAEMGRVYTTRGYIEGMQARTTRPQTIKEGKTIDFYNNVYLYHTNALVCMALVSGDQTLVDFWTDSEFPKDDLTCYPVPKGFVEGKWNHFDLVRVIMAIFPSGANRDTYCRIMWDPIKNTSADAYPASHYSHFQQEPIIFAAEAAYHNGMNAFAINDDYAKYKTPAYVFPPYGGANVGKPYPLNTPCLKRNFIFHANLPNPNRNQPDAFNGWRRYDHPDINAWKSRAKGSQHLTLDYTLFFGYPRGIVDLSKIPPVDTTTPPDTNPTPQIRFDYHVPGLQSRSKPLHAYDLYGRVIGIRNNGLAWQARDRGTRRLGAGVYIVKLSETEYRRIAAPGR